MLSLDYLCIGIQCNGLVIVQQLKTAMSHVQSDRDGTDQLNVLPACPADSLV